MSAAAVLGIDGGGSKTLIARADRDGNVTAIARGSATSPLEIADWHDELASQLRPFLAVPGIAGLAAALPAYGEVEAISADQRQTVARIVGDLPHEVLNDVDAAHIGAFAGGPGLLILSGTGSMAWARDAAGNSFRTGGWGEVIGDEGSGRWIGQRILEATSKAIDGRGPDTALVAALFAELKLDPAGGTNSLEGWVFETTNVRAAIAALAPIALRLAGEGDAVARTIIGAAADELAAHLRALERKLGTTGAPWSYAGGTFASAVLRDAVADRIGRPPMAPRLPPIGGVLLAAARLLDWRPGNSWIERVAISIEAAPVQSTGRNLDNRRERRA